MPLLMPITQLVDAVGHTQELLTVTKEVTVVTSTPFNNSPSPSFVASDPEAECFNGVRNTVAK